MTSHLQNNVFICEQSTRDHCTEAVLDSFLRLTNYLVSHPVGSNLIRNIFDCVLFNPSLWIYSPYKVSSTVCSSITCLWMYSSYKVTYRCATGASQAVQVPGD